MQLGKLYNNQVCNLRGPTVQYKYDTVTGSTRAYNVTVIKFFHLIAHLGQVQSSSIWGHQLTS